VIRSALFVGFDGGGNVAPLLAIAQQAEQDGVRVRVLGSARLEQQVAAAGVPFEPSPRASDFDPAARTGRLRSMAGWTSACLDGGLAADAVRSAERDPVDVVVADCMLLPVLERCAEAGLTTVALVPSLPQFFARGWSRGR